MILCVDAFKKSHFTLRVMNMGLIIIKRYKNVRFFNLILKFHFW